MTTSKLPLAASVVEPAYAGPRSTNPTINQFHQQSSISPHSAMDVRYAQHNASTAGQNRSNGHSYAHESQTPLLTYSGSQTPDGYQHQQMYHDYHTNATSPNQHSPHVHNASGHDYDVFQQSQYSPSMLHGALTPSRMLQTRNTSDNYAQQLYKTEMCRSYVESGFCRYGLKCRFAHGPHELRPIIRHKKYKTERCKNFVETGCCPYGSRCRFIHQLPGESIDHTADTASNGTNTPSLPSSVSDSPLLHQQTYMQSPNQASHYVPPAYRQTYHSTQSNGSRSSTPQHGAYYSAQQVPVSHSEASSSVIPSLSLPNSSPVNSSSSPGVNGLPSHVPVQQHRAQSTANGGSVQSVSSQMRTQRFSDSQYVHSHSSHNLSAANRAASTQRQAQQQGPIDTRYAQHNASQYRQQLTQPASTLPRSTTTGSIGFHRGDNVSNSPARIDTQLQHAQHHSNYPHSAHLLPTSHRAHPPSAPLSASSSPPAPSVQQLSQSLQPSQHQHQRSHSGHMIHNAPQSQTQLLMRGQSAYQPSTQLHEYVTSTDGNESFDMEGDHDRAHHSVLNLLEEHSPEVTSRRVAISDLRNQNHSNDNDSVLLEQHIGSRQHSQARNSTEEQSAATRQTLQARQIGAAQQAMSILSIIASPKNSGQTSSQDSDVAQKAARSSAFSFGPSALRPPSHQSDDAIGTLPAATVFNSSSLHSSSPGPVARDARSSKASNPGTAMSPFYSPASSAFSPTPLTALSFPANFTSSAATTDGRSSQTSTLTTPIGFTPMQHTVLSRQVSEVSLNGNSTTASVTSTPQLGSAYSLFHSTHHPLTSSLHSPHQQSSTYMLAPTDSNDATTASPATSIASSFASSNMSPFPQALSQSASTKPLTHSSSGGAGTGSGSSKRLPIFAALNLDEEHGDKSSSNHRTESDEKDDGFTASTSSPPQRPVPAIRPTH